MSAFKITLYLSLGKYHQPNFARLLRYFLYDLLTTFHLEIFCLQMLFVFVEH